ncbi:MAG: glycoside hydrolase family 15 protein, partial [Burkholderiaceae bacterium]
TGERRLAELELDWLPGYAGSKPVRIGNAASGQRQLDVYGEVMDTLHRARHAGMEPESHAWAIQQLLLDFLTAHWQEPDEGIWEIRGPRQQFTHSKVMAWVAFDRAVRDAERFALEGPIDDWRHTRDAIHAQVCEKGFDADQNSFVQVYGGTALDASLLMIPMVGFLPAKDPRVQGTIAAVQHQLGASGLILRYGTQSGIDNLPPGEGAFLPCTLWLASALALSGRHAEAQALFEHVLTLRNDVGLLSEEIDPRNGRMLGNFPQALSHTALVNTAHLLSLSPAQLVKLATGRDLPVGTDTPQ